MRQAAGYVALTRRLSASGRRERDNPGFLPISEAYTPADLAATILGQLGVGRDREFHDTTGRPYAIYRGEPIRGLT